MSSSWPAGEFFVIFVTKFGKRCPAETHVSHVGFRHHHGTSTPPHPITSTVEISVYFCLGLSSPVEPNEQSAISNTSSSPPDLTWRFPPLLFRLFRVEIRTSLFHHVPHMQWMRKHSESPATRLLASMPSTILPHRYIHHD